MNDLWGLLPSSFLSSAAYYINRYCFADHLMMVRGGAGSYRATLKSL
jgi:hypothetical protein